MTGVDERFWAKVAETTTGCWEWTGCRDKSGYGRLTRNKVGLYAHRYAYELMVGDIPSGLHIDHLCRNPPCVNPYHLEPVTPKENSLRSALTNAGKTHCSEGHELEGDNLKVNSHGRRICLTCRRKWAREYMREYYQGLRRKSA